MEQLNQDTARMLLEKYSKADENNRLLSSFRPLPPETLKSLREYYRVGLTYTSNALEGNSLTESETKVVIEDGLTIEGKPLHDVYEAVGHAKALTRLVIGNYNMNSKMKTIKLWMMAAILIYGASVLSACSSDDDEEVLGKDNSGRVDKYKDMEKLVESMPFSQLPGVSVGNAQDNDAKTGVTVFFFPQASMASAVVLGGGPASREVPLLDPQRNTQPLNALVFGGGSAYGMAAADGVMYCLEEHGHGYNTGFGLVPIVCQSDIFDLSYGKGNVRPDRDMGYLACERAISSNSPLSGNVGVGTGATVGKPGGMATAQKSGIGYAAARLGKLEVGVAVVVNALGDIYQDGVKIAGMTTADRKGFVSAEQALLMNQYSDLIAGNTTIAAVFTNAPLSVADLQKVANIASTGMARCIRPVFTMADGDTVYAISLSGGDIKSDVNTIGVLASLVMEKAIADAIFSSKISEEEYLANI